MTNFDMFPRLFEVLPALGTAGYSCLGRLKGALKRGQFKSRWMINFASRHHDCSPPAPAGDDYGEYRQPITVLLGVKAACLCSLGGTTPSSPRPSL